MKKLRHDEIPIDIKNQYLCDRVKIHKVMKKSKTIIVVYTHDKEKHVWKLTNKNWIFQKVDDGPAYETQSDKSKKIESGTLWGIPVQIVDAK